LPLASAIASRGMSSRACAMKSRSSNGVGPDSYDTYRSTWSRPSWPTRMKLSPPH
jgi:hypothetical protein